MSYPSVKTIMKLECDKEDAIKIRKAMMQESLDVDDRLEKINEILHECGVESAGECDCKDGPPLLYVNRGDTYNTTVCYFNGHFKIIDWGTIVEGNPSLFKD